MPSISVKDYDLLRRIMGMTTSDADGEVLSAIRRANELLGRNRITWEDVLRRTVTQAVEEAPVEPDRSRVNENTRIGEALEFLIAKNPGGDWGKFVHSLHEWFQARGTLTEPQQAALFRGYERAKRGDDPSIGRRR